MTTPQPSDPCVLCKSTTEPKIDDPRYGIVCMVRKFCYVRQRAGWNKEIVKKEQKG